MSSGLTVTTIIMSIVVVNHWKRDAVDGARSKEKLTGEQWLIIGVFLGFIGQSLDNSYWLVAWSSHYISETSVYTAWLFKNGVYFNIPFRQTIGTIAAYCHVRAAVQYSRSKSSKLSKTFVTALAFGALYSFLLSLIG